MYEIPYDVMLMITIILSMISTSYIVTCYFPVFTLLYVHQRLTFLAMSLRYGKK